MIVFLMIAIRTVLIFDPPVAGHSRQLVTSLGLPLCFQPDGGISDSSSESDEEANTHSIPPRPLVPELQRDSLYRWFEMRATWDLLTRPDECARFDRTRRLGLDSTPSDATTVRDSLVAGVHNPPAKLFRTW